MILAACAAGPTIIKEEVGGARLDVTVLVDTRSALDFSTYHLSGSVHLDTNDYLILVEPKQKKRQLDPDIPQIIERLSRKGVSPSKRIVLITDQADSVEPKKWTWLLHQLNVTQVSTVTLRDYINTNRPLIPRAQPEIAIPWSIETAKDLLTKAQECFVAWNEKSCSKN